MSCYDVYDTAITVLSPETSLGEKGAAVGLATAGVFLPGGGYSKIDDVVKAGNKTLRKASKSKVNKGVDAIDDYLGSGAKPKINEAGDLVIESADGTKKFDSISTIQALIKVHTAMWKSLNKLRII